MMIISSILKSERFGLTHVITGYVYLLKEEINEKEL
jgi:hypothetical protein